MYYSFLRTLAKKYKLSVKQARKKFGIRHGHQNEKIMFYYDDGFKINKGFRKNHTESLDVKVRYRYPFGKYSPAFRLKRKICQLCDANNVNIIVHHVRKLTELKPDTPWNIKMIENNRKTLVAYNQSFSHISIFKLDFNQWRAVYIERCTCGSEERVQESQLYRECTEFLSY